jgi:hypothetical protein
MLGEEREFHRTLNSLNGKPRFVPNAESDFEL